MTLDEDETRVLFDALKFYGDAVRRGDAGSAREKLDILRVTDLCGLRLSHVKEVTMSFKYEAPRK